MFKRGQSGNPGGRPRGTSNKATHELRSLAQKLFDAEYWKQTRELIRKNELHPAIHARLLEIAAKEHGNSLGSGITVNLGFISTGDQRTIQAPQVLISATPIDDEDNDLVVMTKDLRQTEDIKA